MNKKQKTKLSKSEFILIILALFYLVSRLTNLTLLPIFNDEAMYLNWGRLIAGDFKNNLWISLTDGQQPLFIWLVALSYWFGASNWLWMGRIISVMAGLGSLLSLFLLGKELFNKRIGFWLATLYLISPFILWYDRLTIKDSFLNLLAILVFYFSVRQAKTNFWRYSLFSGLVLGMALLTKSIAYFFVGLYPLTVFLLISFLKKKREGKSQLIKVLAAYILAGIVQATMYLSPLSQNIGPKNAVFLLSFAEIFHFPLSLWRNNLYSTLIWWRDYYQFPLLFLGLTGFILLLKNKGKILTFILLSWILLPILFEILTAKIYIPRYFLFTFTSSAILAAYGIEEIIKRLKNKALIFSFVFLALLPSLFLDAQMLFAPLEAKLPQVERWQYINGWPSGFGIEKLVNYLKSSYLAKNPKLLIITEKETLVSSALPLYFKNYPQIEIKREFELEEPLPQDTSYLKESDRSVVIVLHHHQEIPNSWQGKVVALIYRYDPQLKFLVIKP
ncbi:hypothetical protein A2160_03615 [Candidatus Beckwithbacteria bacterium RBG_13_42_9]|uniref:Glycosyltransferase RgtA/B/C/D-like domain-containing protein n=1 Tax=Candidatus Beckwithbacteria bacterium RBG_13_42_9 TaxID=1797457 RepID=A0A1F5E8M9_9BACT|nr:MAG: hypothetical protein A2160_03615 [Candidatus Beckwithbacteria bacterium RBG_13_42_9]